MQKEIEIINLLMDLLAQQAGRFRIQARPARKQSFVFLLLARDELVFFQFLKPCFELLIAELQVGI